MSAESAVTTVADGLGSEPARGARARLGDPAWRATATAGVALLAGLAIALTGTAQAAVALTVALAGVVVAAFVLAPAAAEGLHRHPALLVIAVLSVIALTWIGVALIGVPGALSSLPAMFGVLQLWRLAAPALLPLMVMTLAATGGLVLIADALRVRLGLVAPAARGPWRRMTGARDDPRGGALVPWTAIAGVLLVGWAAFLAISLAGRYVAGSAMLQLLLLLGVAGVVVVVIGTPLLISSLTRMDRDKAGAAREDDRQRFAAHLHDSVLQTLALVQRQAHDPAAVARLARRQEHALRAWMAGETELLSETLASALRDVVAQVEDEHAVTVELSVIGDRAIDAPGEALAAAAREALRNAARHAGGAAIFVFAEITPAAADVFVRDDGPGFDPDAVPAERRGLRDAVIGRMAAVGGRAAIDSAPGEGTEVALHLGQGGGAR